MTLEKVERKLARLTVNATPDEVLAGLDELRRECWPDGMLAPGTIAWVVADFLPRWLAALAAVGGEQVGAEETKT